MKRKGAEKRFLIVLLGLFLILLPCMGHTAIPKIINYQGYLTSTAGVPVNGTVHMVFKIYNVGSGGTELWSETQSSVQVIRGVYSVDIGGQTSGGIPLIFDIPYYLGITVGTDPEMTPRIPLTSVGYAFRAQVAETIYGSGTFTNPIISNVTTGTAPMQVSSTTNVTNLNTDMLDGHHASD
jgi:hypothetical protein